MSLFNFVVESMLCDELDGIANNLVPCDVGFQEQQAVDFVEATSVSLTLPHAVYFFRQMVGDLPVVEQFSSGIDSISGRWNGGPFNLINDITLDRVGNSLAGNFDIDTFFDNLHMLGDANGWTGTLRTDSIYVYPTFVYEGHWQMVREPATALLFTAAVLLAVIVGRLK